MDHPTPETTAMACRRVIQLHLTEIQRLVDTPFLGHAEVELIGQHTQLINGQARRLRSAEALISTANGLRPLLEVAQ